MLFKKIVLPFLFCMLSFFSTTIKSATSVYEFDEKKEQFDTMLQQGKPVVAKFYQPWCGACKQYAPAFEAVAQEFSNVTFIAIHCDANKNLERKYGIQGYPTTIFFDSNGKQVDRQSGGMSKEGLRQKVKNLK